MLEKARTGSKRRIGMWGLCLVASIVACDGSGAAVVTPTAPVATTTTTVNAATYVPAAPEPVATVEGFLTAEVAGDFETSFTLLAQDDQEAAGGAEGWVAEHYLVVPTIRGFRLIADSVGAGKAVVSTDLSLEPGLDELIGLTPADAGATWVVVEEAGGWRVAFTESRIDPVFLDDATAPAAAEEWVADQQSCMGEPEGTLPVLGFPNLADPLCGTAGPVRVSGPLALEDAAEAAPFLAAFGPEVGIWARVVEVETPIDLRLVLAPVGERWRVVGVLEP